jgi:hypothetical protein
MARRATSKQGESVGNLDDSGEQIVAAVPVAGKLLRRTEAARMLGVSKSTLRRMEGTSLTPVVGPKNVHLFQEEEVRSVVVTRRARFDSSSQPANGDIAADAFALFDAGVHVVDAVKQLRVAPDILEKLYETWARLRGLLVLSSATRSEINALLLGWDDGSLQRGTDVVAFLKKWMVDESFRRCSGCRTEMAAFCRACAQRWGIAEARQQLAAQKARKL